MRGCSAEPHIFMQEMLSCKGGEPRERDGALTHPQCQTLDKGHYVEINLFPFFSPFFSRWNSPSSHRHRQTSETRTTTTQSVQCSDLEMLTRVCVGWGWWTLPGSCRGEGREGLTEQSPKVSNTSARMKDSMSGLGSQTQSCFLCTGSSAASGACEVLLCCAQSSPTSLGGMWGCAAARMQVAGCTLYFCSSCSRTSNSLSQDGAW